ncbi:MAG: hypothetical protein AAF725_19545 [Acidobacteriota bacterium]
MSHVLQLAVLGGSEWRRVPLGRMGSYTTADLGGLEGRLETRNGSVALEIRGSGRGPIESHTVRLGSVLAVEREDGAARERRTFALEAPRAAVVRGVVRAGPEVEEVRLMGPGSELRKGADGWSFLASGGGKLRFEALGRRQTPRRALLPLRFTAHSATWTRVSATQTRARGRVAARVRQGRLEALAVDLPAEAEVLSVKGEIAGWDVEDSVLTVTPLEPVEESITATLEMRLPASRELTSPLLRVRGSARDRFLTAVSVEGDGLLELVAGASLRPASPEELSSLPSAWVGGQRFFAVAGGEAPRWRVEWAEGTEVLAAQVDRLLVDLAVGESGLAGYRVWAEIRSRGVRHLRLTPPPGFELIEARRDGARVTPGRAGEAVVVPLAAQSRWVYLAGTIPLEVPVKGELQLPMPALSAPASTVDVRALLPPSREWRLAEGARSGAVEAPPSAAALPSASSGAQANFIAAQIASRPHSTGVADPPGLFPLPPGYREIEASWSALSAAPAPLALEILPAREDDSWF